MLAGWSLVLCVALWGGRASGCECRICVNLDLLEDLLKEYPTPRASDRDSGIILDNSYFNQIRGNRKLHACVLMEVLSFYQNLLKRMPESKARDDLLHFLKNIKQCVPLNQSFCSKLKSQARSHRSKQNVTFCSVLNKKAINPVSQQAPRTAALIQICKLDQAANKMDDSLQQGLAELPLLKGYFRGRGFPNLQLINA